MCQHHQVFTNLCTCVTFSQTFPKGLVTQFTMPLDPNNDAKLITRVALDDRYANKFVPLDSTAIYPKPDHKLLYTPMTGKMKCPKIYLCFVHSIPSPPSLMQHMHQPYHKWYDPLHIIMWSCWFIDLDITCSSPLPRSIDAKSSLNLPFTLATGPSSQVLSWSSPP